MAHAFGPSFNAIDAGRRAAAAERLADPALKTPTASDITAGAPIFGPVVAPATPVAWAVAQRLIACAILLFLLPVMVATALAVFQEDGDRILFAHRRIGQNGKTFDCFKFRTMVVDAQERLAELLSTSPAARQEWMLEQKLHVDPRVTRVGEFLRKTSLDELPQLFNVMRGDMNLVGPRPIVESEIARYGTRFRYYRAVKPGITGLWQVSGRNNLAYSRRVALDVLYAKRRSVALDLWILLRTVPAVLLGDGSC